LERISASVRGPGRVKCIRRGHTIGSHFALYTLPLNDLGSCWSERFAIVARASLIDLSGCPQALVPDVCLAS
jgi:hypothetical protein